MGGEEQERQNRQPALLLRLPRTSDSSLDVSVVKRHFPSPHYHPQVLLLQPGRCKCDSPHAIFDHVCDSSDTHVLSLSSICHAQSYPHVSFSIVIDLERTDDA